MTVADGADQARDFSLAAPVATSTRRPSPRPSTSAHDHRGHARSPTRQLGPLDWEAKERDQGVDSRSSQPPAIVIHRPGWHAGDPRAVPALDRPGQRAAARHPRNDHQRPGRRLARPDRRDDRSGPARTARASWRCRSTSPPGRRSTRPSARSTSTPTRIRRPACPPRACRAARPGHRDGVLRRPVRRDQRRVVLVSTCRPSSSWRPARRRSTPHDRVRHPARGHRRRRRVHQHRDGRRPTVAPDGRPTPATARSSPSPTFVAERDAGVRHDRPGGTPGRHPPPRGRGPRPGRVPRARRLRHERPEADRRSRSPSPSR